MEEEEQAVIAPAFSKGAGLILPQGYKLVLTRDQVLAASLGRFLGPFGDFAAKAGFPGHFLLGIVQGLLALASMIWYSQKDKSLANQDLKIRVQPDRKSMAFDHVNIVAFHCPYTLHHQQRIHINGHAGILMIQGDAVLKDKGAEKLMKRFRVGRF